MAHLFLWKWDIPSLFFFVFVFSIQLTENKCFIYKFAYNLIRTADLLCRKQLLYQLSHNLCQMAHLFLHQVANCLLILGTNIWLILSVQFYCCCCWPPPVNSWSSAGSFIQFSTLTIALISLSLSLTYSFSI